MRTAIEPLLRTEPRGVVLLFTALVACGAAVLSALLPAIYTGNADLTLWLRGSTRAAF